MNMFHNSKPRDLQKPVPGCMGRMINIFDFSTGMNGPKLLTEIAHRDEKDPERDCAGVEAVETMCEVGSSKVSLFTDLLGDPVCRIRHSPAFLMLQQIYSIGHNSKIAMLESYSESMMNDALLVRATVDGEEEVVLIFKGFSSLLSSRTVSDPSRNFLPARVIESIDVVKGPFNPSNIEYLEKGLTWEAFKSRLQRPS